MTSRSCHACGKYREVWWRYCPFCGAAQPIESRPVVSQTTTPWDDAWLTGRTQVRYVPEWARPRSAD